MTSRSIVIDTSVLISAALKEMSHPAEILRRVIHREIAPLICPSIVAEYKSVFVRPKFKKWRFPPEWFEFFLRNAIWIDHDPPAWPLSGPGPDDLLFLSFAYQHGATLITGNLRDYPRSIRRGANVTDPATYVAWLSTT